jgi:hypothetical protein
MEAALNFRLLFFQEKRKGKKQVAGIDPKPPSILRRDDMPACSMIRKATTRGLVLWRFRRSRDWARDEGLGREGVVIVKEIADRLIPRRRNRNDSKGVG